MKNESMDRSEEGWMKTRYRWILICAVVLNPFYAESTIRINEIMYDPFSGWDEWVEIINEGTDVQNLRGWTLNDATGRQALISARDVVIKPGDYLVLAPSVHSCDGYPWAISVLGIDRFPRLNNDADCVVLKNGLGECVDSVSYKKEWGGGRGISLERIGFSSFSKSENWGGSTHTMGATPGRLNSISGPVSEAGLNVTITPNPFSPDGDGQDDRSFITVTSPWRRSVLRVRIFSIRGRLVRTLAGGSDSGPSSRFEWDGLDDQSRPSAIGIYVVYAEACGPGNAILKKRVTLVLAGRL
ncbi:MAG TPA: hypothetical protein ENN03_06365 [bacterium]|nr:hypothetical protein [bacterium]